MAFVFGYGSLLFRPDFPHVPPPRVALVRGWMRRFDQGSPDHRGTPERLGRVVTLVPHEGAECAGAVFEITDENEASVLAALDHRERGGYERCTVDAQVRGTGERVRAVTWVARTDNEFYLGPASVEAMVAQISGATGPSGTNAEYVLRLARILGEWGIEDPHVAAVANGLRARG
ncbi:MAG: gamma-glutamylcyclotransferase [Deltaproteobacteria bacterium]